MNTTQNNKLIAEFMGMTTSDNDESMMIFKTLKGNDIMYIDKLKYHESWDWLMPVVNDIINSRDEQNLRLEFTDLNYALCTTNIELVYKAVVEFITEYNNN